jgi:hypothetical protein
MEMNRIELLALAFKKGDRVVYSRTVSNWSRIGVEQVHGIVLGATNKRVRIKLLTGIKGSLTALVNPDRLRNLEASK